MTNKVNGHAKAGEALSGNLEFYTITTTTEINAATSGLSDAAAADAAAAFDKVIEIIGLWAQPVILGAIGTTGGTNRNFRIGIEHTGAIDTVKLAADLTAAGFTGVVVSTASDTL